MRSGQITIFIILGIFMLLGVAFLLYFTGISDQPMEPARREAEARAVQPVDTFVDACFAIATMRSLQLISRQGGMIYASQGSVGVAGQPKKDHLPRTHTELPLEPSSQAKTWYWQQLPRGRIQHKVAGQKLSLASNPWEYPFTYFPQITEKNPLPRSSYCNCGRQTIPPLEGNDPAQLPSVQAMAERFAEWQLKECVGDWSALQPQGIEVRELRSPSVTLSISEADVTYQLEYPLNITVRGAHLRIERTSWAQQYSVRLRSLYNMATTIAENDSTNILYNIAEQQDDGITVKALRSVEGTKDDLITLVDPRSRILDSVYNLSYMRHNRYPALWYINQSYLSTFAFCPGTKLRIADNKKLVIDNPCKIYPHPAVQSPKEIDLQASDPDEDETITYTIWVAGRKKGTEYTLTDADILASTIIRNKNLSTNLRNFTFEVHASDDELDDYQILSLSSGFPTEKTSGVRGACVSSTSTIQIPGLPIKGTVSEVFADDCVSVYLNGVSVWDDNPANFGGSTCPDSGFTGSYRTIDKGPSGYIGGGAPSPGGCQIADHFKPTTEVWTQLHEGNNALRLVLSSETSKSDDGWAKVDYVYISPYLQ